MAQDNSQKIKLLKLYEILQQETDEQNPMTTSTIIKRLEYLGTSCDRRTLAKDIALLNIVIVITRKRMLSPTRLMSLYLLQMLTAWEVCTIMQE